jgi:hypothetical protein
MQSGTKRRLHSDDRSDAKGITGWLNYYREKPEYQYFDQLIRDMNEVDRLAAKAGYPEWPYKGFLSKKTAPYFERINPFFKRYPLAYALGAPTKSGWSESVEGKARDIHFAFILRAAKRGLLKLLDQCNFCKRWFVPRREDQKYCSNSCREKAFRGSDEGKAKRAAYMKRYREGLRRRDRESLLVSKKRKG